MSFKDVCFASQIQINLMLAYYAVILSLLSVLWVFASQEEVKTDNCWAANIFAKLEDRATSKQGPEKAPN
jgi:hypothetical protein